MAVINVVQTSTPKTVLSDSLEKWSKAFISDRKTQQFSKHTIKFYNVELKRFQAYCDDQAIYQVEKITSDMLRSYLLYLGETGRNPGGINAGYRAVKTFLIWYENEVEPVNWKNPIRKLRGPKTPTRALEPVGLEDVNRLLETCQGNSLIDLRDRAILLFLLDTGLRAFELCALDLVDVDPIQGDVKVHSGKGSKARLCMIGKRTRKAVRQYARERMDSCQALWVTDNGERLTYWGLNQMIRRRSKRAGIQKPGLHDFRRAFALNSLRAGMDVFSLQKLLGHSDLSVMRRYLAQNDDDIREAHTKASPVDNAGL